MEDWSEAVCPLLHLLSNKWTAASIRDARITEYSDTSANEDNSFRNHIR